MSAPPSPPALLDNQHFRLVADCTYDWESWHAPDGGLVWVNQAVERITGFAVAACHRLADYPLPLIVPEDRERMAAVLRSAQALSSGNDVEFFCRHRDGGARAVAMSWQPMQDGAGSHLGFRTSVRDVSERQRLRAELRRHAEHLEQLVEERTARIQQLERHRRQMEKLAALGHLAAGVAHEINNPLAGIRNAFELFKGDLAADHPQRELLELIDREIERISGIVHQMYRLYHPVRQRAAAFDLWRTLAEVIVLLQGVADKQGVAIRFRAPEDSGDVVLAEGEVKQVLYNVLLNAIQASAPGKPVEIAGQGRVAEVQIAIRDQGPGIAPEVLPRIFEPFFSTKQATDVAGMGLGLSVSSSLMEAMGGRIDVASQPGEGSCFTLIFPRQTPPEEAPRHA